MTTPSRAACGWLDEATRAPGRAGATTAQEHTVIFGVSIGAMSEQTEAKLSLLERAGIHTVEMAGRVLERTGEEDPAAYRQGL